MMQHPGLGQAREVQLWSSIDQGFGYNDPMLVRLKGYVPWALPVFAGLSVLPAYVRLYVLSGASDIPTVLLGDKSDEQYFVLGDNRDNSEDSREFGPVSEDLLLGKVIAIFATGERSKLDPRLSSSVWRPTLRPIS